MRPAARLVSLDAFRGLTMAAMVIVNNPGDWGHVYAPLLHADWNGWTATDLIFPFFLFIVGVSMTLSRSTMGSGWKIVKRSAVILGLGLFLAGFPRFPLATWRIPGVLARIAMCYLVAAFVYRSTAPDQPPSATARARHAGVLALWAAGLTLAYWAVMMLVPPPGGTAGDLTPSGNLGAFIDRAVFGRHVWSQSKTWDPEGILSSVPAIATTLLGAVAGLWLGSEASGNRKTAGLLAGGLVAAAIGLAWHPWFPINKNLWTSSYVWFTAGAASLLLAACYWVIDVRGWRAWSRPLVILGLNAIALFMLSGLIAKVLIYVKLAGPAGGQVSAQRYVYDAWFVPLASPINASLLYALANLAVLFGILYGMDRRGLYLKA